MYVSHERRAFILRLLQQRGTVRSAELAEELEVTDETIRTDLVALQAQGLLKRVRGGARYILPQGGDEDGTRLDCQLAALVRPHLTSGARVYIDPTQGATALLTALANTGGLTALTLVTASPAQAALLSAAASPFRIACPGGILDKESGLLEDEAALAALQVDIALLSPPALSPEAALYPHALQARWAQAASAAAHRTLLVLPAAALTASAPHAAALHAPLLLTEDAIPAGFEGLPAESVPALSIEDVLPQEEY